MAKHISIHKAEFHKVFYFNSEENEELLVDILSIEKFVYPLKDKNYFYLYDVENEKLLNKSLDPESFKIDSDTEIVSFMGIAPDIVAKMRIPKKVGTFMYEGGDLMPIEMTKTEDGYALWKKVINYINLWKYSETVSERILFEKELRELYNNNISLHIGDFGLTKLFQKIEDSNINQLTFGWTYFSDYDFQMLSKIKQLEALSLLYCYNDNIKWLPRNLTSLRIFGTTIQNLSEINISLPKLIELDLEGNAISKLDNLNKLPNSIDTLCLGLNLIEGFNINELPKDLEFLDLSNNLIYNDFFNQKAVHKNLKLLVLSHNNLKVTSSVLHRILEVFPALEYLELLENKTDGVPAKILGDEENKNCLASVEYFLEGIEFKHNEVELNITNLNKLDQYIDVSWNEKTLPVNVILSDIQYVFSKHLTMMPTFSQYINGLYCFIEHHNCELFIKADEELKQIRFRIQSDKSEIIAEYFHKYLQEINSLISSNSHINVLPTFKNSPPCEFLKDFYLKVFKIDYSIKGKKILTPIENGNNLLINNVDREIGNGKFAGLKYEDISNIAFVLISKKGAYPFIVKQEVLSNLLKENQEYYYYLSLRTGADKDNFIKSITNKYLNSSSLSETELFIDGNVKKKVSCFINTNYFYVNNGILSVINPDLHISEKDMEDVKMDNGNWCKFNVNNNFIELKYIT